MKIPNRCDENSASMRHSNLTIARISVRRVVLAVSDVSRGCPDPAAALLPSSSETGLDEVKCRCRSAKSVFTEERSDANRATGRSHFADAGYSGSRRHARPCALSCTTVRLRPHFGFARSPIRCPRSHDRPSVTKDALPGL
jgi:hypothetical protein